MKLSVILPTYNEKEAIVLLIREIIQVLATVPQPYEIIIVDDNSPDGTYQEVVSNFTDNPAVVPLLRTHERGLASAILFGIRHSTGDKLVIMDTDFNHPPKLIPLMSVITDFFDIAIGSRYVVGGGMETSKSRYIGSKIFNKFIQYLLVVQTKDNLSGFFCFNRKILENIHLEKIFYGYGDYFIRFLYVMQRLKKTIIEIPVVYEDRQGGLSKTRLSIELFNYTKSVIKIRLGIDR
ncbi:MAG: glycosyltransferase [Bacteroidetes bacterium]|nr:MAG: glycosyltransferase [Bacteroidota bacterium]